MADTPGHIKSIRLNGTATKLTLAVFVVLTLVFVWKAVSWQIGSMLGELTSSADPEAVRVASAAATLAPSDPRSRWLLGAALRSDFSPPATAGSVAYIQEAVRLSPYESHWWGELGRSYEQAGEMSAAEASFKKAASLAPEYTLPNWQLGNFYLRQGRVDDAVGPLRIAARYSDLYRRQVFAISWNYFNGDPVWVERFVSDNAASIASLASFYALMNHPEEALAVWNRLSAADAAEHRPDAALIARHLFEQHRYRPASEFARISGLDASAEPGFVTNGDFEDGIPERDSQLFDWVVNRSNGKVEVGPDAPISHGGKRSLRALFRGYAKPLFLDIQQTIAVRPGSRQRIDLWVRTENLRGGSMPLFVVLDAKSEKTLGVTEAFPSGTNDWQLVNTVVDVPEGSDGIRLISSREPCPAECLLSGIFWIDDFSLTELAR